MKDTSFDPQAITRKWQEKWRLSGIYQTDLENAKRPYYTLMMFPYPSAEGLHIGHIYTFSGADAFARFKRMNGYDTFLPIGLDAFGIHSENYALKINSHPAQQAKKAEENFYRQFHSIGNSFDWSRKLETNDPNYYKWTQWLFIQLFKNGLAERRKAKVNFCPTCKTVLADEQVVVGVCERCGTPVEKRELEQWFLKITSYAQRLLNNIKGLDWAEKVKVAQTNWIGKSEGAEIEFNVVIPSEVEGSLANASTRTSREIPPRSASWRIGRNDTIMVFTTRPDTLYGATFLVVAPEHEIVTKMTNDQLPIPNERKKEIENYVKASQNISEQDRLSERKEKTGVFSGLYAEHPLTHQQLPIWIADYVLGTYGTGAIMAVPAHDERDFEFAVKYNLPIRLVIEPTDDLRFKIYDLRLEKTYTGAGVLINSGDWNGLKYPQDSNTILSDIEKKGVGKRKNTYHLRDWLISRQRYWGPPIPMVYCEKCAKKGLSWFTMQEANGKLDVRKLKLDKEAGSSKLENPTSNIQSPDPASILQPPTSRMAGWYPVSESDLPVLLPYIEDFKPLGIPLRQGSAGQAGNAPLANHPEFYETTCPHCGSKARRETDVSDTFLDSSWYFLRYLATDWKDQPFPMTNLVIPTEEERQVEGSPANQTQVNEIPPRSASWRIGRNDSARKRLQFLPIPMYIGGAEHAVLHLLYARFITMFFHDLGYLDFEEPFTKFYAHGLIIKDGAKMSKSKGNVILPDPMIDKFGIDTVRLYLRFLGPFDQDGDFRDSGIEGMHRFVKRVWTLFTKIANENQKLDVRNGKLDKEAGSSKLENPTSNVQPHNQASNIQHQTSNRIMNQTIKGASEDMENLHFNTAVAKLMTWYNFLSSQKEISHEEAKVYLQLLAPFAPHITEELWERIGEKYSIHTSAWPKFDPVALVEDEVTIVIQVNGRVRADLRFMNNDLRNEKMIEETAKEDERVKKYLQGKKILKTIYVPGKILNFVAE